MAEETIAAPSVAGADSRRVGSGPTVVIEPRKGWFDLDLRALWQYRELLYFLAWRDVKVRYKQTAIGASWAILKPFLTMIVFTVVFSKFAKVPSDGLPYPIFAYSALLPWTYFAEAVTRSGASLVGDANLISKVYFPRIVVPISAALAPLVDFAVAFVILLGMMAWFGIAPTVGVVALPAFLLLTFATAMAAGFWLSALNVRYRDVGHTIPFLTQCWMYASPVAYPVSLVPERWRIVYGLNPMAGVVEGFRWALLGKQSPDFGVMAISSIVVVVALVSGVVYFRQMERTFADVV